MRSNLKNSSAVALNIGTIVIVAIMLLVNQVFAKPTLVSSTSALSSGVLSYQGTLLDASGNPLTGSFDMTFRIYNTPSGGTPLWEEIRLGVNAVPINNGLFNLMLGSLVPIPASVWEQPELYLGAKIGNDTEMSPREKLAIVPSAAMAQVAQLALSVPDGSIDSSKIVKGGVVSDNLNLDYGTYCSGATISLPGANEYVEIPNYFLEFTLDYPANVLIWIDGLAKGLNFTGGDLNVVLAVDGSPKTADIVIKDYETWFSLDGERLIQLGSGPHKLGLFGRSWTTGDLIIDGSGMYKTCINYLILGE